MASRTARALAIFALLLAPSLPAQGEEACLAEDQTYTCRWVVNGEDRLTGAPADPEAPLARSYEFELPVFLRTLATTVVVRTGADYGWRLEIVETIEGAQTLVSATEHAQQTDASSSHRQKTSHLVFARPDADYTLRFTPGNAQVRQEALPLGANAPGRFEITYIAERVPDGEAPTRPAGTPEDPHFIDVAHDVGADDLDIRAGWFDDARLGDGLMDAHLRVGSLDEITFVSPSTDEPATRAEWKLVFYIGSAGYYVSWHVDEGTDEFRCSLHRESETDTAAEEVLGTPHCETDLVNATFHAIFPTRAVGSPADGQLFERVTARTRLHKDVTVSPGATIEVIDDDTDLRYPFALGGPAVWSQLDNGRKDPPIAAPLPWYDAPLAADNLPDTLGIAGVALSAIVFLVSLLLLGRSRKHAREMIARIEHVEQAYETDTRRALVELGRLEAELTREFRAGRIKEGQYQLASQRIASVAARFALRRDLGLDDGIPGDPAERRVPVR